MIYNDELKCIHKNLLSWYGLSGECFYVSGNSGQDSTTDSDSTSGSNSTFPEKEYDNIIIVPDESMDIISVVSGAVIAVVPGGVAAVCSVGGCRVVAGIVPLCAGLILAARDDSQQQRCGEHQQGQMAQRDPHGLTLSCLLARAASCLNRLYQPSREGGVMRGALPPGRGFFIGLMIMVLSLSDGFCSSNVCCRAVEGQGVGDAQREPQRAVAWAITRYEPGL